MDAFTCWKTHPVREVNKYIAEEPKMPKPEGGKGFGAGVNPSKTQKRGWEMILEKKKKKRANFFSQLKLI